MFKYKLGCYETEDGLSLLIHCYKLSNWGLKSNFSGSIFKIDYKIEKDWENAL